MPIPPRAAELPCASLRSSPRREAVNVPKPVYNAAMSRALACCALVLGLVACDGLSEFRTDPGEVFEGRVIGGEGGDDTSFIRSGFPARTTLRLTFDPAKAVPGDGEAEPAGTITTYKCDSDACDEDDRIAGSFREAELEPIPQLSHDALGVYEMPGSSRLRNYIFGARFISGEGLFAVQRHAMVFLSLLENGGIEVRILAPSVLGGPNGSAVIHEAMFGVFALGRRNAS
jgi:hypothetical protein